MQPFNDLKCVVTDTGFTEINVIDFFRTRVKFSFGKYFNPKNNVSKAFIYYDEGTVLYRLSKGAVYGPLAGSKRKLKLICLPINSGIKYEREIFSFMFERSIEDIEFTRQDSEYQNTLDVVEELVTVYNLSRKTCFHT